MRFTESQRLGHVRKIPTSERDIIRIILPMDRTKLIVSDEIAEPN